MAKDANGRSHKPAGLPQGEAGTFDREHTAAGDTDLDLADMAGAAVLTERCIELAKRRSIDLLWRTASIEVRGLTFPDTRDVFNGITPGSARAHDVSVLNNLKHAWRFMFDNAAWPVDWQCLSEYNRLVTQGVDPGEGRLRSTIVTISGTEYVPAVPTFDGVRARMEHDLRQRDPEDRALNLFASISRGQWFANGNKRTAAMAANHSLIHDGVGFFALPPEKVESEFKDRLLEYYESDEREPFIRWLKYHAVGHLKDQGLTRAQVDGVDAIQSV